LPFSIWFSEKVLFCAPLQTGGGCFLRVSFTVPIFPFSVIFNHQVMLTALAGSFCFPPFPSHLSPFSADVLDRRGTRPEPPGTGFLIAFLFFFSLDYYKSKLVLIKVLPRGGPRFAGPPLLSLFATSPFSTFLHGERFLTPPFLPPCYPLYPIVMFRIDGWVTPPFSYTALPACIVKESKV